MAKCIQHPTRGPLAVIRVSDSEAKAMVGNGWTYVPKAQWKAATKRPA